ncbi:hypothetical protein NQ315_016735 [Exocentrus adspersus]|uniref:Uncharacterized protein n=1 Tax=Exocentrus adspersus TaxID=1586481 RepID=A0AAV8VD46_9CUCU|nr:hypothetical protein NQ315_016735 [Exocentrus adspersus]
MKVSACTQVFSHTVGNLMKRIVKWDISHENKLDRSSEDTADLILFLDTLFVSLNSSSAVAPKSKPLKGGVTNTSQHVDFWRTYMAHTKQHEEFKECRQYKKSQLTVPGILTFLVKESLSILFYVIPRHWAQV